MATYLLSHNTVLCIEKTEVTSSGYEGDSRSVHTKGKGVGLSET